MRRRTKWLKRGGSKMERIPEDGIQVHFESLGRHFEKKCLMHIVLLFYLTLTMVSSTDIPRETEKNAPDCVFPLSETNVFRWFLFFILVSRNQSDSGVRKWFLVSAYYCIFHTALFLSYDNFFLHLYIKARRKGQHTFTYYRCILSLEWKTFGFPINKAIFKSVGIHFSTRYI